MSNRAEYRRMAKALDANEIAALRIADDFTRRAPAAVLEVLAGTIESLVGREMIVRNDNAPMGFVITNLGEWVLAEVR